MISICLLLVILAIVAFAVWQHRKVCSKRMSCNSYYYYQRLFILCNNLCYYIQTIAMHKDLNHQLLDYRNIMNNTMTILVNKRYKRIQIENKNLMRMLMENKSMWLLMEKRNMRILMDSNMSPCCQLQLNQYAILFFNCCKLLSTFL